jgi:hypothetical protein
MSKNANRLDAIVSALAPVRDEGIVNSVRTPAAAALFATIVEEPVLESNGKRLGRRARLAAFAAVAVLAATLSIPALGVGPEIISIFGGWRSEPDYPAPVPTAADVVIASGEDGVAWKVVANRSDQGLCLGLVYGSGGGKEVGNAGCGYLDLRGDFDPEIRGDPHTKCLASPTEIVPCGGLPHRWIDFPSLTDPSPNFTGAGSDLTRIIVVGVAAADVTGVDLVLTNGQTVSAHVEQLEDLRAPLNFYWKALPLDDAPGGDRDMAIEMVIARDSSGQVLERRVRAWNGNPIGDPDGPPPPRPS